MPKVADILAALPSFYDLYDGVDRETMRRTHLGFSLGVNDLFHRLYQIDMSKSIRTITPSIRREWYYLDISAANATTISGQYAIETEIHKVPELQEGITIEGTILENETDYTIEEGLITFTSVAARALSDKTVRLKTSLGEWNAAGLALIAGLPGSLINGVDYVHAPGEPTVLLKTKAGFDVFLGLGEPSVTRDLTVSVLWAPVIFIDEELVYKNFGFAMDFPRTGSGYDLETYTRIVKGLWIILSSGPTVNNIRDGLSLIFNYPTAPVNGRITKIIYPAAPVFATGAMPEGIFSVPYGPERLQVFGQSPYIFEFVGGPLPPGITFDPDTATVEGTPTAAGLFSVIFRVSNIFGFTEKVFPFKINGAPEFLDASPLPDETQDLAFTFVFNIDSVVPLTVILLSGSLPAGVTFNATLNQLEGTPTESGTFLFTLRATNPAGVTNKGFEITINAVPPTGGSIEADGGATLPDGSFD